MKHIKLFAHYYVNLLVKLGLLRFSLLISLGLVAFAVSIQVTITLVFNGTLQKSEILRSIFFSLLIAPWAIYFFSVVVDQLEESRQRLSKLVSKLEDMRTRDMILNHQLTENITRLNLEIEERKRAEKARETAQLELAEQTALLRSFIDASPDLIYYRNEQGLFSGCNKAMEELTGKAEKDLVGLTPLDVYSEDIALKIIETDQQVFQNNMSLTYEQWLEYSDGRTAYFELRKLPFYSQDGTRLGLVGFGRECTERKRYQDALEKASSDKTAFISTISHELRTPLNGIVGLSRILLESKLTKEQLDYLRTIHVSAITLGNIFNDIIDLDKSERSRLAMFPQPLNLPDFVSEIENISGLIVAQKKLRFSLDRATAFPAAIKVDATRLRQILWNLVGNAVKFTKEGAVNVTVSCLVEDDIAQLRFEIEDSGIGIPPQELDNIFEMYYQVKGGADNLHAMGTGIGLAVSRKLARLMGGDIDVDSEVGEGSTFILTFPAPICETQKDVKIVVETDNPFHILLVEDIELNIMVARNLLESLGHTVTVARCGQEALDIFFSSEPFDLLLIDIQLPDMTGFDIAAKLTASSRSLPPMVALTANVIRDKNEYIEKGLDDAISKPINVTAMTDLIERLSFNARINSQKSEIEISPMASTKTASVKTAAVKIPTETSSTIAKSNQEQAESLLDLVMLQSYVEIVGVEQIYKSVEMFEKVMPEYMQILERNLREKDQQGIVNEAHKIKGAASSIGLKNIQGIAQYAQSPELADWWECITDWVNKIKEEYQHDILVLKQWLDNCSS